MQKFEVVLKWLKPKLLIVVELEGKNADDVLARVKKEVPFPNLHMFSVKPVE